LFDEVAKILFTAEIAEIAEKNLLSSVFDSAYSAVNLNF
jgi:hypothetical protein